MKQPTFTLLMVAILTASTSGYHHPEALEYVLFSIEYFSSVEPGIFSCVFYDLNPSRPFDADHILSKIVRSPRLDHVVKLVFNGSQLTDSVLNTIPNNPSLIVINSGGDARGLERSGILKSERALLGVFAPATRILVLVDGRAPRVVGLFFDVLSQTWRYNKVALIDYTRVTVTLCNVVSHHWIDRPIHPSFLFTLVQRRLAGHKFTFSSDREYVYATDQDACWVDEVARYFNTTAVFYEHGCVPGKSFAQCMLKKKTVLEAIDISIDMTDWVPGFRTIYTTSPVISHILVPRDRPLNAAELLLLPFSWQVWLLLLVVLTTAQAMKHIFPKHFQNDPILLVVCGFERHNLNETGRWEKMILHSLIILMFFASNAFETRIISLMISKPSIQRVKTVNDLETYGITFYADLDRYPQYVSHPMIGKFLINGRQNFWDTNPGMGIYADELTAKVAPIVVFDYERKLPWFVELDMRCFEGVQMFKTSYRHPFLEEFGNIRLLVVETGLYDFWEQLTVRSVVNMLVGRRLREDMSSKIYLDMDDILPAWMILGIGCGIAASNENDELCMLASGWYEEDALIGACPTAKVA
ncbi:hypothetical protein pipiens_014498 [Culex pipiens pipiens]|uniref:Ionotropic receptor n=1 Tax=Culex pipiens pipiens TaxID=38569 RepID=A0ABD1CUC1_CULPP